jgi:hypothetical protein
MHLMNNNEALVLYRRLRLPGPAALHCREIELRLSDDGGHVVLSRYLELNCQGQAGWCSIRHYRVPLANMVRWMTDNGESVNPH